MHSRESDRTVHGTLATGVGQIVRYDRASKWYVEWPDGQRRHISLGEAVRLAVAGRPFYGRPGGMRFDVEVRRTLAVKERQA
jgi:hypothetical protein